MKSVNHKTTFFSLFSTLLWHGKGMTYCDNIFPNLLKYNNNHKKKIIMKKMEGSLYSNKYSNF